jgi:20S proteasome alpha/beta subunit
MTLAIGLHCKGSIVLAAEQEEAVGYTSKRKIQKLHLHSGKEWALGFAGSGDAGIIDNAERRLELWLSDQRTFTSYQLSDALDDVLDIVHTKYIDPDRMAEGISLIIGASCEDGLVLFHTLNRTPAIENSYACAGIGHDIANYLLDRLYRFDDTWPKAAWIAGYVVSEVKESTRYCGGNSDFLVLQQPPHPRWRDLGTGTDTENQLQGLIEGLHAKITASPVRLEWNTGYCDEHNQTPFSGIDAGPEKVEDRKSGIERLKRADE